MEIHVWICRVMCLKNYVNLQLLSCLPKTVKFYQLDYFTNDFERPVGKLAIFMSYYFHQILASPKLIEWTFRMSHL